MLGVDAKRLNINSIEPSEMKEKSNEENNTFLNGCCAFQLATSNLVCNMQQFKIIIKNPNCFSTFFLFPFMMASLARPWS